MTQEKDAVTLGELAEISKSGVRWREPRYNSVAPYPKNPEEGDCFLDQVLGCAYIFVDNDWIIFSSNPNQPRPEPVKVHESDADVDRFSKILE